jgi:hypothetical protein
MSEVEITTCEFIKEVESAAREARKKAASDWSSPIALNYVQVAVELQKVVSRHVSKGQCASCIADLSANAMHPLVSAGVGSGVSR